jgi:hypothetical protein
MVVLERKSREERRGGAIIEVSILGTVDDLHVMESCFGSAVRSRRDMGNDACDDWFGRCI